MFRAGEVWVHKGTLDVALEIVRVQYRGPEGIKVRGKLINRHNGIHYETGTYVIDREHFPQWERWNAEKGKAAA